jgi:hypothetical protein
MVQYPDTITFSITANPVQDLDGEWYVPDPVLLSKICRAEFNSRSGLVAMVDGQLVSYDYTIYQPVHTTDIQPGTEVTIVLHNGRTVTATVKRHENGQLNSRSWV